MTASTRSTAPLTADEAAAAATKAATRSQGLFATDVLRAALRGLFRFSKVGIVGTEAQERHCHFKHRPRERHMAMDIYVSRPDQLSRRRVENDLLMALYTAERTSLGQPEGVERTFYCHLGPTSTRFWPSQNGA